MSRISVISFLFAFVASQLLAAEAPDLTALVGKTVDIQLQNGKQVSAAEVTKVVPAAEPGSIRSLVVKTGKPPRSQAIIASLVVEMFENGQTLDIEFDKKKKTIAHSPERRAAREKHEAEVKERLAGQRRGAPAKSRRQRDLGIELLAQCVADQLI